jgi:hypothetical protein
VCDSNRQDNVDQCTRGRVYEVYKQKKMNAIFIEKMCRVDQICEAKERWYIVRLAHVVSNVKERKHAPK